MIKIDLHTHTVKSKSDASFIFSLEKVKEYVEKKKINAIAITNHNLFDINNYEIIKNSLDILVLPGIEVDLENGHILIISDVVDLEEFEVKSKLISEIINKKPSLTYEEFISIFPDLSKYILIPHYDKKPKIQERFFKKMAPYVYCGEVGNANKFSRMIKNSEELTPVLFSDMRMSEAEKLSCSQTYLDIDDATFLSIKESLKDKTKVFLNSSKRRDFFPILNDGTLASTGLNILFGKRSSGKTFTMDKIFENFQGTKIKYIRQFDLIEKDKDKAQQIFDEKISKDRLLFSENYYVQFKEIVGSMVEIDTKPLEYEAEIYINKLVAFAEQSDNLDAFAKVPLFSEQESERTNTKSLEELITSVITIISNSEYSDVISNYLERKALYGLLAELILKWKSIALENEIVRTTNEIINVVKKKLEIESSQDSIPSFRIITYAETVLDISQFNTLCAAIKSEKSLVSTQLGKFTIEAKRSQICGAQELQKIISKKGKYSDAFQQYDNDGFTYLQYLKNCDQINDSEYYKCYSYIDYLVLNDRGYGVSGGERSEFYLEEALKDSEKYDMLLIDEPESSFDNIFLKEEINIKIKELSLRMPVFVSTHNNVIGGSIKADHIIYTEAFCDKSGTTFKVFSGPFTAKELIATDGSSIKNINILYDSLEGGQELYIERRQTYEAFKD